MTPAVCLAGSPSARALRPLPAVAACLWWLGKHLLAVALITMPLVSCALPPKENLWRVARVVDLVDADDAGKAGDCGAVPSARVGFYLGGTRAHAVVPLGALRDVRPGQTAYFKADAKCGGLRPRPPKEAWLR